MFNHPPFIMHQKKLELVWRFVISGSCSKVHVFGCEQTMRTASRHRHDPLKHNWLIGKVFLWQHFCKTQSMYTLKNAGLF